MRVCHLYLIASRKPPGRVEWGEGSVKCKVWSATCQEGRVMCEVYYIKFNVCLQRSGKVSNVTCKVWVLGSFWDGIAGLEGSLGSILELWEVILELRMVSLWDPGVFLEHFGTRSVKESGLLNWCQALGTILGGFWGRFGVLLEAKSHQKSSKIDAKNLSIFET